METPDTLYAVRRDSRKIAYQVFGDGPSDLVICWGFVTHLDLMWGDPDITRFYERLASFARVMVFDKLGTGLSDPIDRVATLEDRVEDIDAVMNATGSRGACLFGESEAGPTATLFSTMHPERVSALIIFGSIAKGVLTQDDEVEIGIDPGIMDVKWAEMDDVLSDWGKGRSLELLAPSVAHIPAIKRSFAIYERASASPSMAAALIGNYRQVDITGILGAVKVPTLILHRLGDWVPVEFGRYLSTQIQGARYVELVGDDHLLNIGDMNAVLDEMQRFLTGALPSEPPDRSLVTVLFTDIVDSTARAAAMGDAAWRGLLERHHDATSSLVSESGGRVVKLTGDGVLAVFSGPARAIRCARAIVDRLGELEISIRAGIHTGECEVIGDDVGGLAVHVGARVSALANPGEVLVSSTVKELVIGSGIQFQDRGRHELKGVPDTWQLFTVGEQAEVAPVEPASSQMTFRDRLTVRLARRAPGAMRAASRLAARGTG